MTSPGAHSLIKVGSAAGMAHRLEHGLDGSGDELRGLRVDDDVPAEQNAADYLPGVPGRVVRADDGGRGTGSIGFGHIPD